ncbi:MAG: nucleoside hydrolase [Desulfosarcinaceae bacterium]|nr:nucleoside hydrolase [Desulfosarcinaceae bacterium]
MERHTLILDIDNALGIPVADTDDALALALALASPEIELLGITTCAGNCTVIQSTGITRHQLALADRQDIPVAQGRADPLLRSRRAHFAYLDAKSIGAGARFWRRLTPPSNLATTPLKAHEWISRTVRRHPGTVTFVATGSLTNLALALLTDPELAGLLKGVVHMGGGFLPAVAGDDPLVWETPDIPAEVWRDTLRFNPLFDPEATAIVTLSGVPLTLVPVNVTARVYQRPEHLALLARNPSPFHRHLHRYARPWVQWSMADRKLPGAHLHDPLTLALVVRPHMARYRQLWVDVDRLLRLSDPWLRELPRPADRRGGEATVAVAVDADASERWINARIAGI